MNVKELKKELENLPDDMEVVLQEDPEGNGFYFLRGVDPCCIVITDDRGYRPEEVYDSEQDSSFYDFETEEWEELIKNKKSLVLFP